MKTPYKRVLLKLSGEALSGNKDFGLSLEAINTICDEIVEAVKDTGIELAIVVGGGNIFRGVIGSEMGIDRVTGDNVGMLATIINSLILTEVIKAKGCECVVMSAIKVGNMVTPFSRDLACRYLSEKKILIFAAGTGNPYFTTDTASTLRALEIRANCLLKATNVDGIYDKDPKKYPDAILLKQITHKEALEKKLKVMDLTAFSMAMDHKLPIIVFNLHKHGNIKKALCGEDVGSIIKDN